MSGLFCDQHVHAECARRCLYYDLTMESAIIYCREHKASIRRYTVDLYHAVK